jgi:protein-disulfide isomerase
VFRHFPVVSKHPRARVLARAGEAAAIQNAFWPFHDSLFEDQGRIDDPHLWERCERLGLDLEAFEVDRRSPAVELRVDRDFQSGIRAGVTRTPHLFPVGEEAHALLLSAGLVSRDTNTREPPTGGGQKGFLND